MTRNITRSVAAALFALTIGAVATVPADALAQGANSTRAQVKIDRDTFLSMARWDQVSGNWVLKDDMAMPAGVPSRMEVKAMRDKFLSMHTWNEVNAQWVPVTGAPRDMSKLSSAQLKSETDMFLKMYRFDEISATFVARGK